MSLSGTAQSPIGSRAADAAGALTSAVIHGSDRRGAKARGVCSLEGTHKLFHRVRDTHGPHDNRASWLPSPAPTRVLRSWAETAIAPALNPEFSEFQKWNV